MTASRIPAVFAALAQGGRKALIPFITAGDPDKAATVPLMHALAAAGADIIELGVPFSDPMADGPTIQRSSERALKHGTSLRDCLGFAAEFRRTDPRTPVVLMGYANPIEAMGYDAFATAAAEAGVDGVLVVDYPPEESAGLHAKLQARGIDSIFLLSPTSVDARMDGVARLASGYVYYVSLKGVTGAAHIDLGEVSTRVPQIRERVKLPVGVGFGIRDGATARSVAAVSDAVVIGSRLVQEIEGSPRDEVVERIRALVTDIRHAMDEVAVPAA
ncbi:MAG: tryptophan synthase subunit alpha [Burkholderiales bacterium]|jgi:tryptophan synthase alpha chain|nr:tryptophan synthase subunit alpha [Burkholderiales bacterium]